MFVSFYEGLRRYEVWPDTMAHLEKLDSFTLVDGKDSKTSKGPLVTTYVHYCNAVAFKDGGLYHLDPGYNPVRQIDNIVSRLESKKQHVIPVIGQRWIINEKGEIKTVQKYLSDLGHIVDDYYDDGIADRCVKTTDVRDWHKDVIFIPEKDIIYIYTKNGVVTRRFKPSAVESEPPDESL